MHYQIYDNTRTISFLPALEDLIGRVFESDSEPALTRDMFIHSPHRMMNRSYVAFEDDERSRPLSALFYLHTPMRYGSVSVPAGELAIVATHPDFQHQGHSRALTDLFLEDCRNRGIVMAIIEGIPWFYRQFGFTYAIPMVNQSWSVSHIPSSLEPTDGLWSVRPATRSDCEQMELWHREDNQHLAVSTEKSLPLFLTQMEKYESDVVRKHFFILEKDATAKGYFCLNAGKEALEIVELSNSLCFEAYQAALVFLKSIIEDYQNKEDISIQLPRSHKLYQYLKTIGNSHAVSSLNNPPTPYRWQVRILDMTAFLKTIHPVLERRVSESALCNESVSFELNTFKHLYDIRITQGRMTIEEKPWKPTWDLNLPPDMAPKLLLGDCAFDELERFSPDFHVTNRLRPWVQALFPKVESHFYQNY